MYIFMYLFVVFVLFLCIFALIFSSHRLYCMVFERGDWKLWKKVCNKLPEAYLIEHCVYEDEPALNNYKFRIDDIGIGEPVNVIYWETTDTVSVHNVDVDCILSDFDRYHSKVAAEIIKTKII